MPFGLRPFHRPLWSSFLAVATILGLIPFSLEAQPSKIKFDRLGLEEGLSQSSGNAIIEDRQGFLWIGTQDGLNLWDGYEVQVFKHLENDPNSLAENFVVGLWEDSEGLIWMSHSSGRAITVLDPVERNFRRLEHDPQNEATLPAAGGFSGGRPVEDREGRIWLGTNDSGLIMIDRESLEVTRVQHSKDHPKSLSDDRIFHLFQTQDGTLWIATNDGLNRLERSLNSGFEFLVYRADSDEPTSLLDDRVIRLSEGPEGELWVGTQGGLSRCEPEPWSCRSVLHTDAYPIPSEVLGGQSPLAVPGTVDNQGRLWVGTRAGVSIVKLPGEEMTHLGLGGADPSQFSRLNIQALYVDREGDQWIATTSGLFHRPKGAASFRLLTHDPSDPRSLGGNQVNSIYETRSGTLWFGTFGSGYSSYSRTKHKFSHVASVPGDPESLQDNAVFAILLDRENTLWVGTQEGGLHRFAPDRSRVIEHYTLNPGGKRDLGSVYVQALYEDSQGRFWVGTAGGGLVLIDRKRGEVVRRYTADNSDPSAIASNGVTSMMEDSEGTFWVGTGGTLDTFDPESGTFSHLRRDAEDPSRQLPFVRIRKITEDSKGRFWLSTTSGLCLLNRENHQSSCYQNDPHDSQSLSNNTIMDQWEAPDGTFWLATYGGGLVHFDPEAETFNRLGSEHGLPNDSLYSVLPDSQGHLWISGNKGLTRLNPETKVLRNFDVEDGLQSNEFNDRAFFASPEGELFFGGLGGFNYFRPEEVELSSHPAPVVLTAFQKMGADAQRVRTVGNLKSVTISHRDLAFSFEFAALDFSNPDRLRYAYILEGFDEEWIDSGDRRYASYTNLDGGHYTFKVRGTNADLIWSEQEASIEVIVIPPPWKTWWAYLLYAILAGSAVAAYVRLKTLAQEREVKRHRQEADRLKQIDRMKDEFLANTSHELRTPLNGIIGITESLLEGAAGEVNRETRDNLFMVVSSGRRLAHLVDDILDFSKLKNHEIELRLQGVSLRELVEITVTLSRPLIQGRDIELINGVDPDLPAVAADENRLQQILHNLIGNALKFTREGRVLVAAEQRSDQLAISIEDTGIGIPEHRLQEIFESFEQADASSAREFGGTGLGLTITQQLVHLHGGTIEVESEEGRGSCFTFTLPFWDGEIDESRSSSFEVQLSQVRDLSQALTPQSTAISPPKGQAGPLDTAPSSRNQGARVLCVDDEPVNLQVLENFLRLEGYATQRANDGPECLEMLRQGFLPDLILLDVMMPHMTGFEVAEHIRRDFPAHLLPILLVTAKNRVSDLVEGLSSGANDYLSKPFSRDELIARVRTHLNLSRAHTVEAENRRKSEEMEQARAIQLSLLPKEAPVMPAFEIAVHLETATEVGGDYYDFFPQKDGSLFIVTGDATGHGISAGMMVSMTKSALKALDVHSPKILLEQLNQVLRAVDLTRMQMALNVIHLSPDRLDISSAGMPPAFLYRSFLETTVEILLPGLPLGAMINPIYELRSHELQNGDTFVLLSDGLPELLADRHQQDGYRVVAETITRHGRESAENLKSHLLALIREDDRPLDDDVTLLVVKKRSSAKRAR